MYLSREYKITNTFTPDGKVCENTKHRIGRMGEFIVLQEGRGFKFIYGINRNELLKSSVVTKIEDINNKLMVHTLNTIYEFETI